MLELIELQSTKTLHDLAKLLNYEPKFLAYLLYIKQNKYSTFQILKSNGAPRQISAPCEELKALQKKVKKLLDDCLKCIELRNPILGSLSHGFKENHSIITNADNHKKKRYVFNIDIQDFFGSIHVGRIRGFLITNKDFKLQPKIATILAQIICHNDSLPQGSPTSPVASNLIGHLIDIRMVSLASKHGCIYSRYADDITFSTNKKNFPISIAFPVDGSNLWVPGSTLLKIISKCGFSLNHNKTRMQYSESRQTVTGLVVNDIAHTPAQYRRNVRAMTHKLFLDGEYLIKNTPKHVKDNNFITVPYTNLNKLSGMFSYIYMVDKFNRDKIVSNSNKKHEEMPLTSTELLHRDFLFYKIFYGNFCPTILCEGKTDNVYLTCAIKSLHTQYPKLIKIEKNKSIKLNIRFINYTEMTHRVLNLFGGSTDLANLIRHYAKQCGKYKAHPPLHPTIIVIDNDQGSKSIFSAIKDTTGDRYVINEGKTKSLDKSKTLYYIAQNLYVVLTPQINNKDSMMEDFFPSEILNKKHKGKSFEILKQANKSKSYSKQIFAQQIVKAEQKKINFSGFAPILDSITMAINDYPSVKTKAV